MSTPKKKINEILSVQQCDQRLSNASAQLGDEPVVKECSTFEYIDMSLGRLEKKIRLLHNEYTAKIDKMKLSPATKVIFLGETWKITDYYLSLDLTGGKYSDEEAVDRLSPVMDELFKFECTFSDAYKLAMELYNQITIIKEEYYDKGLEGNDLEFIRRYAGAVGIVGYVCEYFRFYYDSHDKHRIEEYRKENERVEKYQESNRKEVKKFLNSQSIKFGILIFICTWIYMIDRYGGWKSALLSLCFSLPASLLIGNGIRYSEDIENVKEKVYYFWEATTFMLILFSVALFIRTRC